MAGGPPFYGFLPLFSAYLPPAPFHTTINGTQAGERVEGRDCGGRTGRMVTCKHCHLDGTTTPERRDGSPNISLRAHTTRWLAVVCFYAPLSRLLRDALPAQTFPWCPLLCDLISASLCLYCLLLFCFSCLFSSLLFLSWLLSLSLYNLPSVFCYSLGWAFCPLLNLLYSYMSPLEQTHRSHFLPAAAFWPC